MDTPQDLAIEEIKQARKKKAGQMAAKLREAMEKLDKLNEDERIIYFNGSTEECVKHLKNASRKTTTLMMKAADIQAPEKE